MSARKGPSAVVDAVAVANPKASLGAKHPDGLRQEAGEKCWAVGTEAAGVDAPRRLLDEAGAPARPITRRSIGVLGAETAQRTRFGAANCAPACRPPPCCNQSSPSAPGTDQRQGKGWLTPLTGPCSTRRRMQQSGSRSVTGASDEPTALLTERFLLPDFSGRSMRLRILACASTPTSQEARNSGMWSC